MRPGGDRPKVTALGCGLLAACPDAASCLSLVLSESDFCQIHHFLATPHARLRHTPATLADCALFYKLSYTPLLRTTTTPLSLRPTTTAPSSHLKAAATRQVLLATSPTHPNIHTRTRPPLCLVATPPEALLAHRPPLAATGTPTVTAMSPWILLLLSRVAVVASANPQQARMDVGILRQASHEAAYSTPPTSAQSSSTQAQAMSQ